MENSSDASPGRTTVLVVDDDAGIRKLLAISLEKAGLKVIEASDGKEAIERLGKLSHLDLVITDLVMPEQEGLETIRLIRARHPLVKIIAISGAFGGSFLKVAHQLGAHETLQKPLKPSQLLEVVRRVLSGQQHSS